LRGALNNPKAGQATDEYGDRVKKRMRLMKEVTRKL